MNCASVAPGSSVVITGTLGHISCATSSIGFKVSGVNGAACASGPRTSGIVTDTAGSSTIFINCAFTSSRDTPGKIRQLILALALCGNALVACPADNIVATQVVRSIACQFTSLSSTATAA